MASRNPIFANKEDANAREAIKLYENKQYKKALKLIDQNLKKNSSHAESLALKGCCNYQTGHKADAESYVLKALAKAPGNYLVNHLAGIYYRNVDNYQEAAKWFKAAVDNGSKNTPIYRDLALMQSQTRDYKNLRESRQKFLESQPGYRANWTAVAIAHHLNEDYDAAVSTLDKIEGIIKEHIQEQDRYEHSECLLYKNSIIAESGDFARALKDLEENSDEIRDRTDFLSYKAKYLVALGKRKEASLVYRQLLQRNPDNASYYNMLELALETPAQSFDLRLKLYDKLASFYPRADPPQFLPLSFLPASHPEFRKRVSNYILSQLKRGVPATFVNVKPLYKNSQKREIIASVVQEFFENDVPSLEPTVFVWTCYFLAQHFLHVGDIASAASLIDQALEHTPVLVELYILKARITKHQGKIVEASDIMQAGRALDLQDRFINSKTAKYLFRANKVDEAIDCISLFTKLEEGAVNGLKDLHQMQANWALVESGEAYARLYKEELAKLQELSPDAANYSEVADTCDIYRGLALKRFLAILKIFKKYRSDEFDFHSYCMRRGTPRDYVETLQWEDRLHSTPIYIRAVKGLTSLYWEVWEAQQIQNEKEDPKDKKKSKNKKAKPLNIKKKSELIAKVESVKNDPDPLGSKALSDLKENPNILAELEVFSKQLCSEAKNYRFSWELSYKLYKAEAKYVLALQALRSWVSIVDPKHKKLRVVADKVLDLKHTLENDKQANPAIVKVVEKGLQNAFPDLEKGESQLLEVYCH
ncbi:putative N-terminal acetyltransferase A complex subunit [Clavispora lusitaniae]|uniref:N-terminal acetyltransferase A complex subunit n=2 Tax=Clavispora lusitaniae TaxID=36911 RepID=C4Y3Z8_CLAL4|nr:uncharacterized protein CLUG_02370 [Clavispora lusitaniae ATCC 42720]KAF5211496.1 hypothetical protein E0198_002810 [Clavispora lusitaniae]EEQ38244.1 hypothetical protein CLUG_02370 [Clavispora lusitaniae ATCC 42720]QFZ27920.1 putative N-terminal acetyltransferase A complex subunit [Clavispora lusitaniae]QFZ32773.1 putative N-terminal acetyltransferase A complex subunit [Clavispora lusitaniae]QFZ38443.1 putative N-terminal acetyltransferase A complex subunit [Clavispora lusitaniae]